jgi:hypothetical protein
MYACWPANQRIERVILSSMASPGSSLTVATADVLVDDGRSESQNLLRTSMLTPRAIRSKPQMTNDGQIQ